jgi:hypothetical protein
MVMLLLLSGVVGHSTAFAQAEDQATDQATDGRWLAFMGCWQPVTESTTRDVPVALVCLQPIVGDIGIEMVSVQNGEISARRTIRADRQRYDSSQAGCAGWDRGDFSAQPGRVFLTSEYVCDSDVTRTTTGLLAMVSSEEWVEVKVVTIGDGEPLTWVTRYELATQTDAEAAGFGEIAADRAMAVRSARIAAARISVDDVIEASSYVHAEGVSAWVAERNAPLELDADELVRMADANVPEDVIDMVIAVTYPSRFAVARESDRSDADRDPAYGSRGYAGRYQPFFGSSFYSPFGYYSPFGFYSPFGYSYGYGSSRYGYGGYGYGYGYGGYVPVVIQSDRQDRGGRVINGQGYRRTRSSSATQGRSASPRGFVGGSSRGSAGRSTSSGSSTGRSAKRRGGGGD